MSVDDLDPARSRFLARASVEDLAPLYSAALSALESLHSEGKLAPVQPWTDASGVEHVSWTPADGSVLECYADMLGLNGRPILEVTSNERIRYNRMRRQALAARD